MMHRSSRTRNAHLCYIHISQQSVKNFGTIKWKLIFSQTMDNPVYDETSSNLFFIFQRSRIKNFLKTKQPNQMFRPRNFCINLKNRFTSFCFTLDDRLFEFFDKALPFDEVCRLSDNKLSICSPFEECIIISWESWDISLANEFSSISKSFVDVLGWDLLKFWFASWRTEHARFLAFAKNSSRDVTESWFWLLVHNNKETFSAPSAHILRSCFTLARSSLSETWAQIDSECKLGLKMFSQLLTIT